MSRTLNFRLFALTRKAFTLVETLVVVSIIVLILALTGPSFLGAMQSSRLTSAGDSVLGSLSQAQQTAMALNVPVELRFFKYSTAMQSNPFYHSYLQLKVTTSTQSTTGTVAESLEPIGSVTRLPENVVILTGTQLSPLLETNPPDIKDAGGNGRDSYTGVDGAVYNAIRFLPDGTVRVVGTTTAGVATLTYPGQLQDCYITMVNDTGLPAKVEASSLPKNFYTIQLDPITGRVRSYRPGQN